MLIATASVAATLAGWAILPANDPQAAAGASNQDTAQPPAITAPDQSNDNGNSGALNPSQQDPGTLQPPDQTQPQSPDQSLPQITDPSGSGFPQPFTRSHSSR